MAPLTTWSPGQTIQPADLNQLVTLLNGQGGVIVQPIQTPAFAAPYTPDPTLGTIVRMTLTGAITVNAPVNGAAGQELIFIWTQDGTGGRVITYNAVYKTGGGAALSTTLSTVTIDNFICVDGTNWRLTSRITGQA